MGRPTSSGGLNLSTDATHAAGRSGPLRSRSRSAPRTVTTSQRVLRAGARRMARRHLDLRVDGLHNIPRSGPLMLAARHYHHLYDGVALVATLPRPLHVIVGLDWVQRSRDRVLMERVCAMAGWPVVLRSDNLARLGGRSAYGDADPQAYQRSALRQSLATLRSGGALVMFPEGYPVVDPQGVTPERASTPLLPFDPGFLRIVDLAQRDRGRRVPILPIGFDWGTPATGTPDADDTRHAVTMRIGAPLWLERGDDLAARARQVEDIVRQLSGVPTRDTPLATAPREAADAAPVNVQVER